MKKFIALLLVMVMCVGAGVGGTLAYLTDRESETNVFTVGNVDIELTENFVQGSKLLPGVDVTKDVKVKNTGSNDAWVWVTIALPSALDSDDASQNVLHFNYTEESVGEGFWTWKNAEGNWNVAENGLEFEGNKYNVYSVLYQTALKPGETTAYSAMSKLYLDTALDIDEEGNWYKVVGGVETKIDWNTNTNGAPKMLVAAYAIQSDANITFVQDAYEKYVGQWGGLNATYETPVLISTAEELLALGGTKINGTYYLTDDIDMTGKDMKPMEISGGANVTFVGNGHTVSNLTLGAAGIHGMTGAGNEVAGLFDMSAPATTVSLTVKDLTVKGATVSCSGYAAAIVGYNSNGGSVITFDNVDVIGANVSADTVAALIGYTTGKVNLTDCDVMSLELTGEAGRPEKVGAFIGTANTETCVVTVDNCINISEYNNYGRVINGATWNGSATKATAASTSAELINAIKDAPVGEETTILLADGTYDEDMAITVAALGKSGGDVVIKALPGTKPVIAGTVTLGYRDQGTGATMYNANVTFDGITFDHAEAQNHSLDVHDVKSLTLVNCTIIGDGEYGISSARGNGTGASKIVGCTFENAGMQLLGNYATGLIIEDCVFNNSCINVQAGNGVTVQNCEFNKTLTAANVGDSFYAIRSNSTPITVKDCEINIDSELTEVATEQAKWYLFANRGTTNWTVEDVAVTLTDAALMQTELKVTACTSTGKINTTNLTVNGIVQ